MNTNVPFYQMANGGCLLDQNKLLNFNPDNRLWVGGEITCSGDRTGTYYMDVSPWM